MLQMVRHCKKTGATIGFSISGTGATGGKDPGVKWQGQSKEPR